MVEKRTTWLYLEPLLFDDWKHLAEISKKVKKNHSVVRQHLSDFEKNGILKKKIVGRLTMYKFNYENSLIIDIISLVEKERIVFREKDLIFKEMVGLIHSLDVSIALVFGSFVDNPKKAEDIDLLLIGWIDKKEIKKIEEKLNKKIHLINIESLKDVSEGLREEIRKRHLIINGVEGVIRWLI